MTLDLLRSTDELPPAIRYERLPGGGRQRPLHRRSLARSRPGRGRPQLGHPALARALTDSANGGEGRHRGFPWSKDPTFTTGRRDAAQFGQFLVYHTALYPPGGKPPAVGSTQRNPDLRPDPTG